LIQARKAIGIVRLKFPPTTKIARGAVLRPALPIGCQRLILDGKAEKAPAVFAREGIDFVQGEFPFPGMEQQVAAGAGAEEIRIRRGCSSSAT